VSAPEPVHALIVDDDRAIQRLLADALAREGFSVTVERDGEWALRTFEQKPFDVVLLDLLLPSVNGYEVARRIKATPKGKETPIVMISGIYKSAVHKQDAVERFGAAAFLEKPFKLAALRGALRSALGERYPKPPGLAAASTPAKASTGAESLADNQARDEVSFVERAARQVPSVQSLKGDLAQRPFGEVIADLHRFAATGALLLRHEQVKKIVYFRDGVPISVKSNLLSECLGRVMVKERMISEAECEDSLTRMKASGRQQGTVLIEMGCISPHNLVYGLQLQLRAKLLEVFSWEKGEFQFSPKVSLPQGTVKLDLSVAAVIHAGVKRYPPERLRAALGEVDGKYLALSDDPRYALQELGLPEEELEVLRAADGTRTVSALRGMGPLSPIELDRLIYAMRLAQLLVFLDAPRRGTPPPVPLSISQPMRQVLLPEVASVPGSEPGAAVTLKAATLPELPQAAAPEPAAPAAPAHAEHTDVHAVLAPEDDTHLREKLLAKVAGLRKMDSFAMLGVTHDSSAETIGQAFYTQASEFHPDKFAASESAEVRALAQEIYGRLGTAHQTLTDPESRQAYLAELNAGEAPHGKSEEVDRMLAAESRFKKGLERVRQRDFAEAHQHFQEAIDLYGNEGEFYAYLAWAQFQKSPENEANAKAALKVLDRGLELNPSLDKSYLFAGYIWKALGKTDRAEKLFEQAIECNPGCHEALHELSILSWASRLSKGKH
jgi:DNA-binding response OmpR family regulator/curved DNA-binding protein CbpA